MRLNIGTLSAGRQRAFALAAPALGLSAAPEGIVLTGGSRETGLALARTETGWQLDTAGLAGFVRGLGLLAQHRNAAVAGHIKSKFVVSLMNLIETPVNPHYKPLFHRFKP